MEKIALVRGKFLNQYEMQIFEPLSQRFAITAFGSLKPFHDTFAFPVKKLPSPMDLPDFPLKMQVLNRCFIDAQYLFGLENCLKGFDIAHSAETYYHYTQQCLLAKRKGYVKKVIATVLENIPFNNEGIRGRKTFKKRAREELDHIIALTERTKTALLLEGADEKKVTVIPHGIDTSRFSPLANKNHIPYKIRLLFCGRLETYKGIYEIIYALRLLMQDRALRKYSFSLTMVGEGSEKEKLLTMEKRLGVDKFIFHRNASYKEMPAIYKEADIYVAPSKASTYWTEQYNTTLLEAQATGLPIVTTYSGGIPENVGNAAMLVQPDDCYSLMQAVRELVLFPSLREEYSKKARKRATTIHDRSLIAQKIRNVYLSLL